VPLWRQYRREIGKELFCYIMCRCCVDVVIIGEAIESRLVLYKQIKQEFIAMEKQNDADGWAAGRASGL